MTRFSSAFSPLFARLFFGLAALAFAPVTRALDPTRALKDYRLSEWQVTDGLPYPSIAAIAQSRDGYLWIGTRTGLGRFDGISFATFTTKNLPQLRDDRIASFFAADDGTLWVGTAKGIACYRDGAWSRPTFGEAIDDSLVWAISAAPDGAMLIAVHRGGMSFGLFAHRAGVTREIRTASGTSAPRLNEIRPIGSRTIVAGLGLHVLEDGVLGDISADAGVEKRNILALESDHDGTFWIGTPVGLSTWDGGQRRSFSIRDGLPSNSIRSLLFDSDANLWVGTSNGVARYTNGVFQQLYTRGMETLSNVLCFFEDREKNLWIGTDNGLYCLRDANVTTFTQSDGLPVNPTLCVLLAKDGSRWIGTIGGGLAHLSPAGIRTYRVADGLAEDSIGGLAEDAAGGLWIAYYTRGLSYLKDGKVKHYNTGDPVRVRGIAVGPDHTVWAMHSSRVFRLEGDEFQPVLKAGDIEHFRALHLAPDGKLWITTGQTISYLRDGEWTHLPTPLELRENPFQHIFSGSDGAIWALQDGPLIVRIRDDRREHFPMPRELGPLVYSGFQHRDELWVSFRAGVARIPLAEFDAVSAGRKSTPAYTIFNETDGMRSRAPNNIGSPGATMMPDGSLWFATSIGIAIIHPDRIRTNQLPPHVVIEHVLADKTEYSGEALLRLPPGRGELAFQFTAPTFVNPTQTRFKYRLTGFDQDWVEGGRHREAHYGGLPPGKYRFEVIAASSAGVWNTTGATRDLVLQPHFYQRWWFFVFAGALALGAGGGVYTWRSRRLARRARELQRQNEELERRIADRTAELRTSYDALRASEYFYHSLIESLPQAIARKDAAGRYTYVNATYADLVRRPVAEIVGGTDRDFLPPELASKVEEDDRRVAELHRPLEYEEVVQRANGGRLYLHVKKVPLIGPGQELLGVQILCWDMTVFRETEDKLKHAQRELVEISRLAGIAEMATGVLHNLGNALNTVKVSSGVALGKVHRSSISRVRKIADLLAAERHRLAEFFATDARGAKLPEYVAMLADQLEAERAAALRELESVAGGVEHVAQLIAAQQENARVTGVIEDIAPTELMEYACRMSEATLCRHDVTVVREFMSAAPIIVERQKALQILGHLVRNAAESLIESAQPDKRLTLRVHGTEDGGAHLAVIDNGGGIPAENLPRIFEFGFTSKKNGHGFGLHNSALTAKEMGGNLTAHSAGVGQGATFVLILPPIPPNHREDHILEPAAARAE